MPDKPAQSTVNGLNFNMPPKRQIMLTEWSKKRGSRHQEVVRIIESGGKYHNLGSICLGANKETANKCNDCIHLDLAYHQQNVLYLIGEIAAQGGNFRGTPQAEGDGACQVGSGPKTRQPRQWPAPGNKSFPRNADEPVTPNNPFGNSSCWGGTIYESWRAYRKAEHAVAYLKRYFDVRADGFNERYSQEWIDQCSEPSEGELEELAQEPCGVARKKKVGNAPLASVPPPDGNPPAPLPQGFNRGNILAELVRWIHSEPFQRRRRYAGQIYPVQGAPRVTGWDNRVKEYAYAKQNGPHFVTVYKETLPFIKNLNALRLAHAWAPNMAAPANQTLQQISSTAEKICIWGGVTQRNYDDAWKVVRDAILAQDNHSPMNSGWTKVASFATDKMAGNEQTIWDSRVATSLICRIDQILHQEVVAGNIGNDQAQAVANQFGLGTVASLSVGTRPRALHFRWPNGYGRWDFHFLGSALVREVVAILNDPANGYPRMPIPTFNDEQQHTGEALTEWTVFGVGLVLFMDGW